MLVLDTCLSCGMRVLSFRDNEQHAFVGACRYYLLCLSLTGVSMRRTPCMLRVVGYTQLCWALPAASSNSNR
jgi:hypothetical protein